MKKTMTMFTMVLAMAAAFLFPAKASAMCTGYDSTYVISYSNSDYLTSSDLDGLTLQGINYAKNEIYARHGYIFKSTELNNFFNTKTWYSGSVSASSFSDTVFNAYESANIKYLTDLEFGITKDGYLLDQPGYSFDNIYTWSNSYTSQGTSCFTQQANMNNFYIISDSNSRYLSEAEISGMSLQQLCYARNEIYARHGYIFKSNELSDYFYSQAWYYPTSTESEFNFKALNDCERANSDLLYSREYSISATGYALY